MLAISVDPTADNASIKPSDSNTNARNTTMSKRIAEVEATQKGFRATVKENGKFVASAHFNTDLRPSVNPNAAADESYRSMKKWLAGFGCC